VSNEVVLSFYVLITLNSAIFRHIPMSLSTDLTMTLLTFPSSFAIHFPCATQIIRFLWRYRVGQKMTQLVFIRNSSNPNQIW